MKMVPKDPKDSSEDRDNVLYLDRRAAFRVDYRARIRYAPAAHPLRLKSALLQNISKRGVQLLSPHLFDKSDPLLLWIPLQEDHVISVQAKPAWVSVEDRLGDSPYWIRSGIRLNIDGDDKRKALLDFLDDRSKELNKEQEMKDAKVSYVF